MWSAVSVLLRAITNARVRAADRQATMQLGRIPRRWETTQAGDKGCWWLGRQTAHACNIVCKIKFRIKGLISEYHYGLNFSSYTPRLLKGDRSRFDLFTTYPKTRRNSPRNMPLE